MGKRNPLRSILNDLKWNPRRNGEWKQTIIRIRDYLDEKGYIEVPLRKVFRIKPNGLDILGIDNRIPYHRIQKISIGGEEIYRGSSV